MKNLLFALTIISASTLCFAQSSQVTQSAPATPAEATPTKNDFAMHKQKMTDHLQTMLTCVNNAQTDEALKACHAKSKHGQRHGKHRKN